MMESHHHRPGPPEAFVSLGNHTNLAIFLALGTALTVFIISYAYLELLSIFPGGGGGYIVANHTISEQTGMIYGSALLIDYMLTITVSIAASRLMQSFRFCHSITNHINLRLPALSSSFLSRPEPHFHFLHILSVLHDIRNRFCQPVDFFQPTLFFGGTRSNPALVIRYFIAAYFRLA